MRHLLTFFFILILAASCCDSKCKKRPPGSSDTYIGIGDFAYYKVTGEKVIITYVRTNGSCDIEYSIGDKLYQRDHVNRQLLSTTKPKESLFEDNDEEEYDDDF